MENIERLQRHILRWECGVIGKESESVESLFARAARKGVINDPHDPGGATFCGVTLSTYREWCHRKGYPKPTPERLGHMDYSTWRNVLKDLFWSRCNADKIHNGSIALLLVDWCWVNGPQAIRDAQTAFSLAPDGIVGPKTLAALNGSDAAEVFSRLRAARERSYRRLVERRASLGRYLKGWINRVDSIGFHP